MDDELNEVLDGHFLDGLGDRAIDELRAMRARCQRIETRLSFLRRLAQGRIDIVTSELQRRSAGEDPGDLGGLIASLPDVLADRTRSSGAGHLPQYLEPGRIEGELVDEFTGLEIEARLGDVGAASEAWLTGARDQLVDYEKRVSTLRRSLFERIDTLTEELARRYRAGEVDIDSVIAGS